MKYKLLYMYNNITHVFTDNPEQFNASLMNKTINFFQKTFLAQTSDM